MSKYDVNLHFQILGKARENLKDTVLQIPAPPPGVHFIPVVGDFVKVNGLDSFRLVVVAREIAFHTAALEVNCYLDTVAQESPAPDLKVVK